MFRFLSHPFFLALLHFFSSFPRSVYHPPPPLPLCNASLLYRSCSWVSTPLRIVQIPRRSSGHTDLVLLIPLTIYSDSLFSLPDRTGPRKPIPKVPVHNVVVHLYLPTFH